MAKKSKRKNKSAREKLRRQERERIEKEKEESILNSWMTKVIMFVVAFAVINLVVLMMLGVIPGDALAILLTIIGLIAFGICCLFAFIMENDKDLRNMSLELFLLAGILICAKAYLMYI